MDSKVMPLLILWECCVYWAAEGSVLICPLIMLRTNLLLLEESVKASILPSVASPQCCSVWLGDAGSGYVHGEEKVERNTQ